MEYMEDIEEFKKNLQSQKKKVDERINPILQSYHKEEITKKELVEKLADAFHILEEEYENKENMAEQANAV